LVSSDTDNKTDFDNDDNDNDGNQESSYSSSPRRSSGGNNKNVNIFGLSLPADTVNLATGILAAIGTIGTGIYLYDRYNQGKQQQEQQKKQQDEQQVQELIRNLQLQEQQQLQNNGGNPQGQTLQQGQQGQPNQNNGVYINPQMLGNSEYLKALNNELDSGNNNVSNDTNDDLPLPSTDQQQPMINMNQYVHQAEQQKKQSKQNQQNQPQIDTSIYQSSQAPDPTTYF
jgi:hypothetical protein